MKYEYNDILDSFEEELGQLSKESNFLPITSNAFLYLSGTPFKALAEENSLKSKSSIGLTDEQEAKSNFSPQKLAIIIHTQLCLKCDYLLIKCQTQ